MTAQEAYNLTVDSAKDFILKRISEAARNSNFKTSIRKDYFDECEYFIDELKKNGYDIDEDWDYYTISWRHPSSPAFNQ